MGYRIVYGEDPFEKTEGKSHLRAMTAGFALALVVLVRLFFPAGAQVLREVLLPGDNEAFVQLTEDIRNHEPLGAAVTVFCQRIVEDAVGQTD